MSVFQYLASKAQDGGEIIFLQDLNSDRTAEELKAALAPIENGAWVGEGADAFIQDMSILIGKNDLVSESLASFRSKLQTVDHNMYQLQSQIMTTVAS